MTLTPAASARRSFNASTMLAGVLIAVAVTGVATLSAAGSGALQHAIEFAGFGKSSAVETEQQRQAAAIAGLDAMVATMSNELGDLSRQNQVSGSHHDDLLARVAELDREIGSLREKIAREGLFQQDTVLRGALTDLTDLQTTVDQNKNAIAGLQASVQQSEAAQQQSLAEIARRLHQLESSVAGREVTSSVTKPAKPRAKVARKQRPAPAPELSGAPDSTERVD